MKKAINIICIIITTIIILGITFFIIDYTRAKGGKRPIFCIPSLAGLYKDGGTVEYFGIGYKVIDFNRLGGYDEIKIGTYFMNYNDFSNEYNNEQGVIPVNQAKEYTKSIEDININLEIPTNWNYEEIIPTEEDDYKFALKLYKNSNEESAILYYYNNIFGVCGTERTSKKIKLNNGNDAIVGYSYDNDKVWLDISFYEIDKNIAVINKGLNEEESNELLEFIKTFYIGNKFNLVFYQKNMIKPNQKETIISKGEIEGINYNIYAFEGNVAVNLKSTSTELTENSISLRDALLQNKITIEEIMEKADKDFPDVISYDDGGSKEYHYDNLTIIKLNKLDGNKDIYIGKPELKLNDLNIKTEPLKFEEPNI